MAACYYCRRETTDTVDGPDGPTFVCQTCQRERASSAPLWAVVLIVAIAVAALWLAGAR